MLAAIFGMAVAANAQNKILDNWSIGVDGGVSTNFHDLDTPNGANVNINLTKTITPILSLEFQIGAGFNDNANWNMMRGENIVDNLSMMGMTKINLMNWFGGYKGAPRFFEIQARGGFGYMREFFLDYNVPTHGGNDLNRCVTKFGFDFDFNLGKQKEWTVSLRPAIVLKAQKEISPMFKGCDYNSGCDKYGHNALAQISAGVTYHLKNSSGTHYYTKIEPKTVTNTVEKVVEKVVEKPVEKVVEKTIVKNVGGVTVEFAQNKAILTETAKALLNGIERGTVVALDGFASPEGNKAYNLKLSQRRCDEVKTYLEGRGVKVTDVNAHGAAGKESQRVVYVRIK